MCISIYFVAALRRHGYEAHSTQECSKQEASEEEQLTFAADRNWTLLSCNIDDFSNLHRRWNEQGKEHAGILLTTQFNPDRTLRRLFSLLFLAVPEDLHNRTLFLSSWLDV